MTREEAYALGNIIHKEVITFYESQFDGIFKKCNIYPQYRSFIGNISIRSKLIDQIFNDHEAQLKAKDEEIDSLKKCNKLQYSLMITGEKRGVDKGISKARSIVAMLFWEWKKAYRYLNSYGDFIDARIQKEREAYYCFQQAYKMLKDNA